MKSVRYTCPGIGCYDIEEPQIQKPDDADLAKACMIEPISVCLHGIDRCNIRPGYKVAVSGGGSIGLVILQLAKMSGASRLTLIEPIQEKRDLAKKFGTGESSAFINGILDNIFNHMRTENPGSKNA